MTAEKNTWAVTMRGKMKIFKWLVGYDIVGGHAQNALPTLLHLALFLLFFMAPTLMHAQTHQSYSPPVFTDPTRLQKIESVFPAIDKFYKEAAEKNHFPGYAFGIVVDGKLMHTGSGGYTDIANKIPATPQSFFRIASMTKSFTAMAILQLRDAGKLNLDDPVYLYIPELKDQQLTQDAPAITIRDLLTHASGLPQDDPWGDRKLSETDEQLIALIKKGLYFSTTTETTTEYSNLAYAMLGHIINKVSGMSYQSFIAENIWQPLGMQAAWEFAKVAPDKLAHGYKWVDDNWQEEALLHDGSFGAMGGIITSIEAFSRYVALHQSAWPARDDADTGPIKRSELREMQYPWRFYDFVSDHKKQDKTCALIKSYGYGLRWYRDCNAITYVGHSGGLPGFGSNWIILPEYGIGVILFANVTYAPANDINLEVLETLVKAAQLKPRELPASEILQQRKQALLKFLPDWEDATHSPIFAENFFLDHSVEALKKQTRELFLKAGKIVSISEIVPENQLRGSFVMKGEKAALKIKFTLTPTNPPQIQAFEIKLIS